MNIPMANSPCSLVSPPRLPRVMGLVGLPSGVTTGLPSSATFKDWLPSGTTGCSGC